MPDTHSEWIINARITWGSRSWLLLPERIYIRFCQDHHELIEEWEDAKSTFRTSESIIPRTQDFGAPTQSLRSFPGPLLSNMYQTPIFVSYPLILSPSKSLFSFPASHLPASSSVSRFLQGRSRYRSTTKSFPPPPHLALTNIHHVVRSPLPSHKFCSKLCPAFLLARKKA